jgi:hypothetical protein
MDPIMEENELVLLEFLKIMGSILIYPSSPALNPILEIDLFLQSKVSQKALKEEKIEKIKKVKTYLFNILKFKINKQIQNDLLEGLNYLDFLIQKIKNPIIQSPKQIAYKQLETKIIKLN